jgi:hypothetical protein
MQTAGLEVGMRVRYQRTGTTGTVLRLECEAGKMYAELDSTHLLYRIDQLVPVKGPEKKEEKKVREDLIKKIEAERSFAATSEFQESLKNLDQSCEGGG